MNKDFRIDFRLIKEQNNYTYFVCLNYVGQNFDLIETIEDIKIESFFYEDMGDNPAYNADDYCLSMLTLSVGKYKNVEGELEVDDDNTIKYSMKSDVHLGGLYNRFLSNELKDYPEIKKLKGIGEVILCLVLNNMLSRKLVDESSIITLEASGKVEGKGMLGLVKYYERLGFKQAYPELLEIGLKNSAVPMKATIGDVVNRCIVSDKSNIVSDIMKELIVREF